MILYLLNPDIPALHRVALGAVRAHLPLVNICVAILAVFAYVGEYRLCVALNALDFFMHAAQRVFRFVVVEFRNGADGLPGGRRVAVFAGDG